MKHDTLLVIGVCSSILIMPAVADDSGNTAFESSVGAAAGNQTQGDAGTMPDGADGAAPKAITAEPKGKVQAAPKRKSAGTGTLLRYIYDQDKKGNIKIEGMTDTAPPP